MRTSAATIDANDLNARLQEILLEKFHYVGRFEIDATSWVLFRSIGGNARIDFAYSPSTNEAMLETDGDTEYEHNALNFLPTLEVL